MPKISKKPGKSILTSIVIQNISQQGIWLLINDQEYFLPFKEFPWFLKGTIEQIYNVELLRGKHLHWPALDIDLELESLKYPASYPLKYS